MMATCDNMIDGRICSHTLTPTMFKSKNLTAYEILQCLYVDDGAFLFGTRDDLQKKMIDISPLWQVWNGNAHRTRNIDV